MLGREEIQALNAKRTALEQEADVIVDELTTTGGDNPPGVDKPLVDREGYPRSDIDIYRVRALRQRFHVIQNDHKTIMKQIEIALLQQQSQKGTASTTSSSETAADEGRPPKPYFDPNTGSWIIKNSKGAVVAGGNIRKKNNDDVPKVEDTSNEVPSQSTTIASSSTARFDPVTAERPVESNRGSITQYRPFARIDSISNSSDAPALVAGLQVNDLFVQVDNIFLEGGKTTSATTTTTTATAMYSNSNECIRAVGELIPRIGGAIAGGDDTASGVRVTFLRLKEKNLQLNNSQHDGTEFVESIIDENKYDVITLMLRPRPFNGRGLLGCHIVPIHN